MVNTWKARRQKWWTSIGRTLRCVGCRGGPSCSVVIRNLISKNKSWVRSIFNNLLMKVQFKTLPWGNLRKLNLHWKIKRWIIWFKGFIIWAKVMILKDQIQRLNQGSKQNCKGTWDSRLHKYIACRTHHLLKTIARLMMEYTQIQMTLKLSIMIMISIKLVNRNYFTTSKYLMIILKTLKANSRSWRSTLKSSSI